MFNSLKKKPFKSKKPEDTAFKQQKLRAWQPIINAGTVYPKLIFIGVLFIPLGVFLLYSSDSVQEIILDYTQCESVQIYNHTHFNVTNKTCATFIRDNKSDVICRCRIPFRLDTKFNNDVFMYYGLSNFFQNHRRYVKSRDDHQLLGDLKTRPSFNCEPFDRIGNKMIVPCGAIANSLFNDVLTIYSEQHESFVPLIRTGIAWFTDKTRKFQNPANMSEFKQYAKPVTWKKRVDQLDLEDPTNNGFQNEDLMIWMRTAAFSTFRKLYRRINHTVSFYKDGLPPGYYVLYVDYNYDVISFAGTKRMILSNTSILGGKNSFLGIAYITFGSICIIIGVIFAVLHFKYCKR